ncbi:MAG: diaminopimelate epimerase [Gudongella sp.]|nr:diaminopimelate epimerase [Gudongella sp.]
MKLNFIKTSPAGNTTVFVLDQVPRGLHSRVAKALMGPGSLNAEQVGFIEKSLGNEDGVRLQMMGGEFCGNASRALAAYMVYAEYPQVETSEDGYIVPIQVSGFDMGLICKVKRTDSPNAFRASIEMPLPTSIIAEEFIISGESRAAIRVDFPGITHFVVDEESLRSRSEFLQLVREKMEQENFEAFGVMYHNFEDSSADPVVYVKETDSLVWERSCASGTAALGAAISYLKGTDTDMEIKQPGGSLAIKVKWQDNQPKSILLDGTVDIVVEGLVNI